MNGGGGNLPLLVEKERNQEEGESFQKGIYQEGDQTCSANIPTTVLLERRLCWDSTMLSESYDTQNWMKEGEERAKVEDSRLIRGKLFFRKEGVTRDIISKRGGKQRRWRGYK